MFSDIIFAQPKFIWLFLLLPLLVAWYVFVYNKRRPTLQISTTDGFKAHRSIRYYLQHLPFACRCIAVAFVIVALARPQSTSKSESIHTEGIDIVLCLDISSSMLAQDFKPNRLEAAKDIATQFIAERISDRLALIVFAGESFTQCPLTTDRVTLVNLLKDVECGMIEDGTAIGNGLATSVSRLEDSKSVSRVVILLTDGVNNSGEVPPIMAAEIAQTYGIRVYTIGVGTIGTAPYPMMTPYGVQMQQMKVEIDEDMMHTIAEMTGGKYFRATSNTKLLEIYKEINQMEKAKVEVDSLTHLKEEFLPYAIFALIFLLLDIILRLTILRRLP
jgi:Ca-activated chloride channel family protein